MIYHDNNHAVAIASIVVACFGMLECVQICYVATVYVAIIFIHWLITVNCVYFL